MKKSRYTEEQIIKVLKEWERVGGAAKDVARLHGLSDKTLYTWKAKYGGMEISEAKRLKALEEENRKLKRIVADLTLDITMLKDVNSKKW